MDGAEYEEIAGQLRGLLIRLDDRLSSTDGSLIAELIDVGEVGLAVEQMADQLSEYDQPLAADERADLLTLVERLQLTDRAVRALATCPDR
ncbi:MafI family immunity protein [Jatrophihabitans telluris]|uniref:MafI family immunity protein n=1 Tax=Jatrophihabitans telluris TaxID=2038343 RepID=A0ABY4R1H5_9ACTN|nr:MafI family immunity protein [Jatrophihabitans telluris]UQX89633.1 MafI family immunity protein [Jatrophihabitans telluris]